MEKIKFIYLHNKYEMYVNKEEYFKDIIKKYSFLINLNINQLYFSIKGNHVSINDTRKVKDIKNKNIIISVTNLKKIKIKEELNHIICPECNNLTLMNVNDNNIVLEKCIKNHVNTFNNIKDFIESQNIKEDIKCEKCQNYLSDYNNNFYFNSSKNNICPLCIKNEKNKYIEYNNKYYYCIIHGKEFISYCNNCNTNLCFQCEEKHKNHKIIYLKQLKSKNKNEMKDELKEFNELIKKYRKQILILNGLFKDIIEKINCYIEYYNKLYSHLIKSLDNLYNYEVIYNIRNIKNKKIMKNIISFLNEDNFFNKFKLLINIYDNIPKNEMILKYKNDVDDNKKVRIFGEEFVKNNKDNCYILIKSIIYKNIVLLKLKMNCLN